MPKDRGGLDTCVREGVPREDRIGHALRLHQAQHEGQVGQDLEGREGQQARRGTCHDGREADDQALGLGRPVSHPHLVSRFPQITNSA